MHMTDRSFNPSPYSARRRSLLAAGATLGRTAAAHAQASGETSSSAARSP
jgi:hypothetical protein